MAYIIFFCLLWSYVMFIAITIVVCNCGNAVDKPEPKPAPEPKEPRVPYIPKVEVRKKKK